jgi:hypothetical protein
MAATLIDVLKQMEELSLADLLTLQRELNGQIRIRSNSPVVPGKARMIKIPGAYQPTLAEIEASLAENFTPEELTQIGKTNFKELKISGKSLSEMVNEDREDRF